MIGEELFSDIVAAPVEEDLKFVRVYLIKDEVRSRMAPRPPTLRHWVQTIQARSSHAQQDWCAELVALHTMQELGRIVGLIPGENGYIAQFSQTVGHPLEPNEIQVQLAYTVSNDVADAIVNGGVLTGKENIAFGMSAHGVIVAFMAFVEPA